MSRTQSPPPNLLTTPQSQVPLLENRDEALTSPRASTSGRPLLLGVSGAI